MEQAKIQHSITITPWTDHYQTW